MKDARSGGNLEVKQMTAGLSSRVGLPWPHRLDNIRPGAVGCANSLVERLSVYVVPIRAALKGHMRPECFRSCAKRARLSLAFLNELAGYTGTRIRDASHTIAAGINRGPAPHLDEDLPRLKGGHAVSNQHADTSHVWL